MSKILYMSLLCKFGFHSYVDSSIGMNWRMSTDKSIEWTKKHFGWHEFRICKGCDKMQQREVRTWYGRILRITEWGEMDKESTRVLDMYKFFDERNNKV